MDLAVVYNRTDRPVVISGDGRIVDGRSWGAVDLADDAVTLGVDAGVLVVCDEELTDDQADAYQDAVSIVVRTRELVALDVNALRKVAATSDLGDVSTRSKDELVRILARNDVEIPTKSPSKKGSGKSGSNSKEN